MIGVTKPLSLIIGLNIKYIQRILAELTTIQPPISRSSSQIVETTSRGDEYLQVTNEFNQQQKAWKTLVLTVALYS